MSQEDLEDFQVLEGVCRGRGREQNDLIPGLLLQGGLLSR